jgi:urease accessory protein
MTTSITALMRALQFGDSVLPVGSFSFSNGLEAAIAQRVVHDTGTLRQFVAIALEQAARSDGVALLEAHRGAVAEDMARVVRADIAVVQRKLNEEMRTMNTRMGRKLGELVVRVVRAQLAVRWLELIEKRETPGTFPVGMGLAFACLELSERDAYGAHQYGIASMMLGAALRLMKLHYLDGQAILYEVNAAAEDAYARAAPLTLDDMAAFAPQADILAAIHVDSHVRMFMS